MVFPLSAVVIIALLLWILIMKFINVSVYWHGTGGISSCLNRLLQKVLCCVPAIILMISFCKVKIFALLEDSPKDYSIFYYRKQVCIIN